MLRRAVSLDPQDLRVGASYEGSRGDARTAAVELRRRRRIDLGDLVSVVFENRDTLRAAVEEALRAERLTDPEQVAAEAERFGPLLPSDGGLAASLYLEVADAAELTSRLAELEGIAESVHLEIDGSRSPAAAFPIGVTAGPATPAAYVRFKLTGSQREAWLEGARVVLAVEHPRYSARSELSDLQRAAVAADLAVSPTTRGR